MRFLRKNRGFIKIIVIMVAALILLAFLGLNLRSIVHSQAFQDNWQMVKDIASTVWNRFLRVPIMFIWNEGFIRFVWNPIFVNLLHFKFEDGGGSATSTATSSLSKIFTI